jgi:hypothetical protein
MSITSAHLEAVGKLLRDALPPPLRRQVHLVIS